MKITYQGQIGVVAGLNSELREVSAEATVAEIVAEIAASHKADVARFLVDGDGGVNASLFVALDDDHVIDYTVKVGDAREILLMPPMAGG